MGSFDDFVGEDDDYVDAINIVAPDALNRRAPNAGLIDVLSYCRGEKVRFYSRIQQLVLTACHSRVHIRATTDDVNR